MATRQKGFTIVELLITIVVIAILASLSYVGYTTISNRAHDSAVQSDLANMGKRIAVHMAEGNPAPEPTTAEIRPLGLQAARPSYSAANYLSTNGPYNLLYCASADRSEYALVAWSKSGNSFAFANNRVQNYASDFASRLVVCGSLGLSANTPDNMWLLVGSSWHI